MTYIDKSLRFLINVSNGTIFSLADIIMDRQYTGEELFLRLNLPPLAAMATTNPKLLEGTKIGPVSISDIVSSIEIACSELGLDTTLGVIKSMKCAGVPIDKLFAQTVNFTFQSELKNRIFLSMDAAKTKFFEYDGLDDFYIVNFPEILHDIKYSRMCYALNCNTASVFHSMRAAEIIVQKLALKLNCKIINSNSEIIPWGNILSKIGKAKDQLNQSPEKDNWSKIHSLLYSLNRAYRTKTAHPVNSYDSSEALSIIEQTKGLMDEAKTLLS